MKRTIAILSSALMLAMGATTFVACNDPDEQDMTVMNISCNPSVEFVLDKNDKVLSVNALNEEGNLVISGAVFTDKSAEEAAKLFVQISNETGFIVSGNASVAENEIEFSFSGDTKKAEELYNDVKGKVNEYLSAENITAQIEKAEAITKEKLEELVAECAPHLEEAEIKAMEYQVLVNEIYGSRKETAEYYSQELKNAYYETKAFIMEQAELKVVIEELDFAQKGIVELLNDAYVTAMNELERVRKEYFIDENSNYQQKLKEFREKKVEYLKYRQEVAEMDLGDLTESVENHLQALDTAVDSVESSLESIGALANQQISAAKDMVTRAYNAVIQGIGDYSAKVNANLAEISTQQQTAKAEFFTTFETEYAAAITAAKNDWAAMKDSLERVEAENTQP